MTPQEKAQELWSKYRPIIAGKQFVTGFVLMSEANELTKQCALIALEFANEFADDSYRSCYGYKHTMEYLEQVKQEINKL
jgi:hypothetical protein